MHELSIARSLIDLACEHAGRQGSNRVHRIKVRLGVLSGLLRPLYFCFASACKGTCCEHAILDIEEVPLTVMCPRCDEVKTPGSRYSFCCPTCGTPTPDIVTGREMQLVALELDQPGAHPDPGSPGKERACGGPLSGQGSANTLRTIKQTGSRTNTQERA